MKKLPITLAVIALATVVPVAAKTKPKATPTPDATPSATPAEPKSSYFYIQVTSIEAAGKVLIHKYKNGTDAKFHVSEKTEIKQNNQPAKFEEIKVGDWVAGTRLRKNDNDFEVLAISKFGPLPARPSNVVPVAPKPTPVGKGTPAPGKSAPTPTLKPI